MDKKPAEMDSINYMTAVNLWMTFHFDIPEFLCFFKEYIVFEYVF